ncbi:MAG: pilus assembly protein PilM [Abditibacteriota bacterium]|nr:pilus assembly protein PilM [Abditibacteriota bacterium]
MADKKLTSGKLLGIDIGTNSVKVAEVEADADGITVIALGEAPMLDDIFVNEDIQNPRQLASIIKKLCKDCGTTCKKAVVAITAPTNTLVRTLEVPKSDSVKQIRLSVKYEVERLFPHSSYDTEFDFVELPGNKEGAQSTKVFVVASYRKLVEDILKVTKLAGLTLDAIEVGELAMGRSLVDTAIAREEPICGILDLGASKSTMCVYDGTTIKNPGMGISVAGNTFTREISNTLGISIQEAEEMKKDYAMLNLDIIKEYYDKKYSNEFEFDSSSFDTAFDDPNYNPAYAGQNTEENPFEFDGVEGESNPFETASDNPFETTGEENPFEKNDEPFEAESGEPFEKDETATESAEASNSEPAFDGNFDIKEENEKLEEEVAAKSGKQFKLEDLEDQTDASGRQENQKVKEVDQEKSNDICQMLLEQLENLQNEIRFQLDEYYNNTGINVQKLIITGGTSKIPGMDEFLNEYLGIEVMKGNPRDVLKFRMTQTKMDIFEDLNSIYPIAIGLAMRDFVE